MDTEIHTFPLYGNYLMPVKFHVDITFLLMKQLQ